MANEGVVLTHQGVKELEEKLEYLKTVRLSLIHISKGTSTFPISKDVYAQQQALFPPQSRKAW